MGGCPGLYHVYHIIMYNPYIYIISEGVVMGPAFGFRTRFIIAGKVERASPNNKATNLQNLEETKKNKKQNCRHYVWQKPRQNQKKNADTSPGSAEHGLCSFVFFGFFGFLEVSATSDNAWLDRTCAFFLPFFLAPGGHLQTLCLDMPDIVCAVSFLGVWTRFLP